MAKKWSDVAASSAFQALSFDEQEAARRQYFEEVVAPRVPTEDLDLARSQFLTQTELRRPSNDPVAGTDFADAATAMQGTLASTDNRSLIQRMGDFLRPAPKGSVMEGYVPSAKEQQAEIDKRLSYGAGPISAETVRQADAVRSSRTSASPQKAQSPQVERVVQKMDERRERTSADLFALGNDPQIQRGIRDQKAEEWRTAGEWAADTLSGLAQGGVSLVQLPVNIVAPGSGLADSLRGLQKDLQDQESDVLKAQRQILRERVMNEDGFFGKYFATVKELVTNPALGLSEGVKQLPNFLGVVGLARAGGALGATAVGTAGRAAPTVALADAIAGGGLTAAGRAAGTTAGGVGASMVMAGGDAAGETYETLTDKNRTPRSVWEQNPDYQKLVAEGVAPDDAIKEIATAKARLAALITAPLGVLGYMGGEAAVATRGLGRAAADALTAKGAAKTLLKENVGEQLEEAGTAGGANVAIRQVDPSRSLLEGVPEAAATAAVTSTPFGLIGAASNYQQARQQLENRDPFAERVAAEALRTEEGTSKSISPIATVTNFTPPDAPTKQAGMVDIEVPIPNTTPALPDINPSVEQQFGLDKLRMGGSNVGTSGVPGGLAAGSGGAGGDLLAGGVAAAGRGAANAAGVGEGPAGGVRANDQSALPAGGEAGQQAAPVAKIWAGRAGDGYATEGDANQALPGLQRKNPTLDWTLQRNADGKFIWSGIPKETTLGTQTAQAQQVQAQGQEAAATAGAAAAQAGTAAASKIELSDTERAGLKLALPAPAPTLTAVQEQLAKRRNVTVEAVPVAELSDPQRVASAVARLMGNTLTVVRATSGDTANVPNGFINRLGGKHIFIDAKADDAPVSIALHEGLHSLPAERRKALNTALLEVFNQDQKGEFLREFGYTADKFDEEAPAMMAQAISKRADFWEQLRDKMGNREFGEVAKVILAKLNQVITGAREQYGDAFVKKYVNDVVKARDLLTTAYAESMQAQGFKPDSALVDVAASQKARAPIKLADYDAKTDNFNKQQDMAAMLREAVPAETIAKADGFVAKYYKERQPVAVSPADRLKAEILLRPKMQAAEQAKPEYDQKILDIAARTGAVGQMLAQIKGIKRAAEKLVVEEKFQVDNIKDLLRSTIVVESFEDALPIVEEIRKEFDVIRIKDRAGAGVVGQEVSTPAREDSGGYADILINVRMPNGTIGEIQINTPAMLAAKSGQGHKLYEAAREQPEGSPLRREIYGAMRVLYDAAFEAANLRAPSAQARNLASEMGAPLAGRESTAVSSSPESASLKTLPSGKRTNSSPENEATNSQPGGKEAGTFIEGSPDNDSVSQSLYESKKAGDYEYTTDKKGRITVTGDVDRIKFLTRTVAKGTQLDGDDAIVFKATDAESVVKALRNAPKVDPEIASAIRRQLGLSEAELASTSLAYQTGKPRDLAFVAPLQGGIPETVRFLEERRRASGLRLLDIAKPEDQDTLARLIAAETLAAIRSSGNALEWYDETIAKTLAMAAVKYPELANDANAQMVFRLAMAITSQGLNVENNLKFTMRQYDAYRRTGKYPEVGEGDSSQAMVSNFKLANELIAEMTPDLFRRFLVTPFTIGELNSAGFEPGGELVDETVLGSSVFGPKIGFGFYSNLNGNFEPVTMDMWFMRTIGRLIGRLRSFDAEKFGGQLERFRGSFDERGNDGVYADRFDAALIERARTDQDAAVELARQVKKAHERDFKENRADFDAKTRKKSSLVLAAETMIQSVDKPKDVPGNGTERRQLREVVRKAVAEVERVYGQRIPPAAMQALIWYPEQELYKAMGVKLSVTSQDYAGATEKVLTEEGYDAKRLRSAAQSGARRVRQANARDVERAAQGNGQGAGRSGPLEAGERGEFLRARYERTELAKERLEPKRKTVVFEVAPDPNNAGLTNAWRTLSQEQRLAISERVARTVVPRVLTEFNTDGIISPQVGSYLDDTNPSFSLLLNKGDVLDVSRALGFVLAQDSMMVVSPKPFKGGDQVGAIFVNVGDKSSAEIDEVYQKLREIRVNGEQPVGGQSYANGRMIILNYSDVSTDQLAILVDQKLNKAYSVEIGDVYSAFPEKKEYDYASEKTDPRGGRADLRRRARALRAEATAALEAELRAEGIELDAQAADAGAGQEVTYTDASAADVNLEFSQRTKPDPKNTVKAYKLFRVDARRPGLLFPLFVDANTPVPIGTWLDADVGAAAPATKTGRPQVKSKLGPLAYRPGWHAGDLPLATHIGGKSSPDLKAPDIRPADQVWAEVEMAADRDWQTEADKRGINKAGKFVAKEAHITDQIPEDGYYRYKTNSNMTGNWLIGGSMKVTRIMSDAEVKAINDAAGTADLPRQAPFDAAKYGFDDIMESRRLPKVSPQSQLDQDIKDGAAVIRNAVERVRAGRPVPSKLVVGRLPHVLNMLGARTQDFDIARSIVEKVFDGKHRDEFPDIDPVRLVRAMYQPAMVFKSKDGVAREFELVLPITNENGAMLVPIKVSVDNTDPLGAVMSIYNKRVSTNLQAQGEKTIMRRINDGSLVYIDPLLAKQALTGRQGSDVKANENFVSWPGVWPKLQKLIADRKVKTDMDLMRWIGDNFDPRTSPAGFEDAPAFSNKASLADDLQRQQEYLQQRAEQAGYKDIDEMAEKDYDKFVEVAAEWRAQNPVEEMYSNKARDSWIFGRDELGRMTFGAGAKAYRYSADVANIVLEKLALKPISTDLSRAMRQMKVEIAKAQELTVDVAGKLGELSQQEREMISDIIEGELKRGATPPRRVLEIAASMQSIMSEQTAELVRLGMLSADAAGRWDGKYLPRFYESKLKDEASAWAKATKALIGRKRVMQGIGGSSLKGRGKFQTVPVEELESWLAEGWEERDANFDPDTDTEITIWRDYTREERDDMGEIRDAMFRFVMGYNKSQRDISLGRLYENLADTVASKREKEGYVQVPKTNIEDTYAKRYGKLSGMWVPQEVLDHLTAFDESMQNELLKVYLKGMSLWKEGKTVLNPVSHANNILSNLTMAHFAGVSYWDVNKYVGATRDLVKNDPMVQEAKDAGLFLGTMTQAEMVQLLPDQLKVLAAKTESKAGQAVEGVWNALSFFLRKPLGKAYEAEDLFFRYLIYRDARERGLEPADAVDYAQKFIFTYDDLPKGARILRNFALPFFAYTYKVIPALAQTALEHPLRFAAPAMALYTINAAMYAMAAGGDDDWWEIIKRYVTDEKFREEAKALEQDEREKLPDWMKGYSLTLGTPKAIRLGMDEATGLPVFLDVSRIFPGGDLFDAVNNAGGIPLLSPITPNTPILTTAYAMLANKDTWLGKSVVDMSDTSAEAAAKRATWLWKMATPAIALGNSHFERAMNVLANQVGQPIELGIADYTGVNRQGQPVQTGYAALQTVGIKAIPVDLELSAKYDEAEKRKLIREIEAKMRSMRRSEQKGVVTPEAADRFIEKQKEKRQRLKDGLTVDGDERN